MELFCKVLFFCYFVVYYTIFTSSAHTELGCWIKWILGNTRDFKLYCFFFLAEVKGNVFSHFLDKTLWRLYNNMATINSGFTSVIWKYFRRDDVVSLLFYGSWPILYNLLWIIRAFCFLVLLLLEITKKYSMKNNATKIRKLHCT